MVVDVGPLHDRRLVPVLAIDRPGVGTAVTVVLTWLLFTGLVWAESTVAVFVRVPTSPGTVV